MKLKRKVKKWGNSGGIPIPKKLIGKTIIIEITTIKGEEIIL